MSARPIGLICLAGIVLATGAYGIARSRNSDSTTPDAVLSGPHLSIDCLSRINGLIAADFDADGARDLAVLGTAAGSNGQLGVFLNRDRTGFEAAGPFVFAGSSASGLATSDLNRDGHPDLVVSQHDTFEYVVLLGRGDGTFDRSEATPAYAFDTGVGPHSHNVALIDTDGDGHDDIVSAQSESNRVLVTLGNGDGTFHGEASVLGTTGNHPYRITVADVNADGELDLLTPNVMGADITVLLRDSTGFRPVTIENPGLRVSGIVVGDLNADGRLDLLTSEDGRVGFGVLLGDGAGSFERAPLELRAPTSCQSPLVLDLNGNGRDDVVAVSMDPPTLYVWEAQEAGLDGEEPRRIDLQGIDPQLCASADFDHDGLPDVVAGGWNQDRVTVVVSGRD